MRRMRQRRTVNAEINVTSLLDIVFVLLIAFMIVAPALKHGVELELPKVRNAQNYKEKAKPVEVRVVWRTGGEEHTAIMVDGKDVDADSLVDSVQAKLLASSDRPVTLEADKRVPWDVMADLISRLRSAGVENLGIITLRRDGAST